MPQKERRFINLPADVCVELTRRSLVPPGLRMMQDPVMPETLEQIACQFSELKGDLAVGWDKAQGNDAARAMYMDVAQCVLDHAATIGSCLISTNGGVFCRKRGDFEFPMLRGSYYHSTHPNGSFY